MTKEERDLFWILCESVTCDTRGRAHIIRAGATARVLGLLAEHRMAGSAYKTLQRLGGEGLVSREFLGTLALAYEANCERNRSYLQALRMLSAALREVGGSFAAVKGAVLCWLYPEGCRTANDVDLLVRAKDLDAVGGALRRAGFEQGRLKNGVFVPATRKEILNCRMMRGETVPYFRKVSLPFSEYLEVDLNFSLDETPRGADAVDAMLSSGELFFYRGIGIPTLSDCDFFLHLCAHLYKEATGYAWVAAKRDLSFYKFADAARFLISLSPARFREILARAKELGLADACCCTVIWCAELYAPRFDRVAKIARENLSDPILLRTVRDSVGRRTLLYAQSDLKPRFFREDRRFLLKESENGEQNEKTEF